MGALVRIYEASNIPKPAKDGEVRPEPPPYTPGLVPEQAVSSAATTSSEPGMALQVSVFGVTALPAVNQSSELTTINF